MQLRRNAPLTLLVSIALFASGCGSGSLGSSGGGGGTTPPPPPSTANEWTWMGGSSSGLVQPVYGTQGAAAVSNTPGGRFDTATWEDGSGNFWLFGGTVSGQGGTSNPNDLWEYSPSTNEWTFIGGRTDACVQSGSVCAYEWPGIYGTKGVASSASLPGGRAGAVSWTDKSGNFWLFGGLGFDSIDTLGYLNDLWEFNPSTRDWTWISGSSTVNASGIYGSLGSGSSNNTPGARAGSTTWSDGSGDLWLFGGGGAGGDFNDLWEFNPSANTWTWMNGNNTPTTTANGVYGSLGVAAAGNVPGARSGAATWIDSAGDLWLFGGNEEVSTGSSYLNDLWEFNTTTHEWTWVAGSNSGSSYGAGAVYGTMATASTVTTPGAQNDSAHWTDNNHNLWLFDGNLWEFNPTTKEWTWVSGWGGPLG